MIQSIFNFDNINFNGGNISCDGGSILLLSFLKKYNLLSSLDDIPFNDTRRLPKYSNSDIVTQIVLRNLLGYFNQADQMTLVDDPLLSQCINACSQPTLSRFFDRINMKTNMTIKEHIQRLGCDYVNRHVENIILDVDSTKIQSEGTFGIIKQNMDYVRLKRRGNINVKTELLLIGIAYNIRKYHNKKMKKKGMSIS